MNKPLVVLVPGSSNLSLAKSRLRRSLHGEHRISTLDARGSSGISNGPRQAPEPPIHPTSLGPAIRLLPCTARHRRRRPPACGGRLPSEARLRFVSFSRVTTGNHEELDREICQGQRSERKISNKMFGLTSPHPGILVEGSTVPQQSRSEGPAAAIRLRALLLPEHGGDALQQLPLLAVQLRAQRPRAADHVGPLRHQECFRRTKKSRVSIAITQRITASPPWTHSYPTRQ